MRAYEGRRNGRRIGADTPPRLEVVVRRGDDGILGVGVSYTEIEKKTHSAGRNRGTYRR